MGIGVSLVLIAVGAILRFATTAAVNGFNVQTIGLILIIVGAAGLVLSVVFWGSWGGYGISRRRTVTRSGYGGEQYDARSGRSYTRVEENELA